MSKQSHEEKAERDLDEWDAEIEAEFQRVTGGVKAAGRRTRNRRHVGFPLAFLVEVCRLTKGRAALVAAVCIYRRFRVSNNRTVTLPLDWRSWTSWVSAGSSNTTRWRSFSWRG